MVDTTRIDKITSSEKAASKDPAYSDFYVNFNRHPETGALVKNTDAAAVKRAIRNLIMTNRGERMFQPTLGTDLYKLLFENMSEVVEELISTYIKDAIRDHEPRARVLRVVVNGNEQTNSYDVAIVFEIINNVTPVALNLTLYRVR